MAKFKENGKLKLLIIVGTRPEIIRLAAVINECRKYFDCLLAHTGQNYDYNLNGVFFKVGMCLPAGPTSPMTMFSTSSRRSRVS